MVFSDIHTHSLHGVDDGAKTESDMISMVEMAYKDGARRICLTPHYHPGFYGNNKEKSQKVFEELKSICSEKYPDLGLVVGNELHYSQNCISWLNEGMCRTMNGTRYILVDFSAGAAAKEIMHGMEKMLSSGYLPILAHTERYSSLNMKRIRMLKENGVLIQVNAGSVFGDFGFRTALKARRIIGQKMADFISSDSHGIISRLPGMKRCYSYAVKKAGEEYAGLICDENARKMIFDIA